MKGKNQAAVEEVYKETKNSPFFPSQLIIFALLRFQHPKSFKPFSYISNPHLSSCIPLWSFLPVLSWRSPIRFLRLLNQAALWRRLYAATVPRRLSTSSPIVAFDIRFPWSFSFFFSLLSPVVFSSPQKPHLSIHNPNYHNNHFS